MPLDAQQERILNYCDRHGKEPQSYEMYFLPGYHRCPDWDYLPICADSPEFEHCGCERIQTLYAQKWTVSSNGVPLIEIRAKDRSEVLEIMFFKYGLKGPFDIQPALNNG